MERCADCGYVLENPSQHHDCPNCHGEYSDDGTILYHLPCGRNVLSCDCFYDEDDE